MWDGQVGHDASEIGIGKWEFAANSTQSLGRHTWVGVAKKGGATRRLAGYSTVGRPPEAGQKQACPASAAFVAEGNSLEGIT